MTILVLGAGRSSASLIDYLLHQALLNNWQVVVGDVSEEAAREKINGHAKGKAIQFDIGDEKASAIISTADVVISLLPAMLHPTVAKFCLVHKKNLVTASYVSADMEALAEDVRNAGLIFINECGLDPGIDHMSAMQVIDNIKRAGGVLTSFESFTGGLIAPQTDPENPWRYKFTWNPRNVVLAGQGTAKYLQNEHFKFIPYQQLFKRITPVSVPGYGEYEGYANRDSLKYIDTYGLRGVRTMLRGTLRNKGYCDAWNVLLQLGCCDDTYQMDSVESMTHRSFINSFLDFHPRFSVEEKIASLFNVSPQGEEMSRLKWSGFFDEEKIGLDKGSPAQIVEHILNKKWKMNPQDIDLVVMWHRFQFVSNGKRKEIQASLVATGDDAVRTAMAKTVGLPLGIAAKLIIEKKISQRGVIIPIQRELYDPILAELNSMGIKLVETETELA